MGGRHKVGLCHSERSEESLWVALCSDSNLNLAPSDSSLHSE